MPLFEIHETRLRYVTEVYVVEADDEDQALDSHWQESSSHVRQIVGNAPIFCDDIETCVTEIATTSEAA